MKATLLKSVVLVTLVFAGVFNANLSAKSKYITNDEVQNEKVVSRTIYRMDDYLYNHMKYNFSYNEEGYVSCKEALKWDEVAGEWSPYFKIDYTYNDGKVTMEYAKWNKKDNEFNLDKEKSIYEFNGNNDVMNFTNQKWDDKAKDWNIVDNRSYVNESNTFAISQ